MKHFSELIGLAIVAVVCLFLGSANAADFYWNAGDPASSVDMGAMTAGDTLYICGWHNLPIPQDNLTVTVDGLRVSGACPGGAGTINGGVLVISADYVKVEDFTSIGLPNSANGKGITIKDAVGVSITRAWLQDNRYGIFAPRDNYADNIIVRDSVLMNLAQGISMQAYTSNLMSVKKNWVIERNYIQDIYQGAQWYDTDNEAVGVQGAFNLTVRDNVIRNAEQGILIWSPETGILTDVLIQGNVLINMSGEPTPAFYSYGISKVDNHGDQYGQVRILDNVVVGAEGAGIRWGTGAGAAQVTIARNRLVGTGTETGEQLTITGGNVVATDNLCLSASGSTCQ